MLIYGFNANKDSPVKFMKSNIHFQVELITHWKCLSANQNETAFFNVKDAHPF